MKINHILIILILLLNISLIISQTDVYECKKQCAIDRTFAIKNCNENYNQCNTNCKNEYKECIKTNDRRLCRNDCSKDCSLNKKQCLTEASFRYDNCPKNCKYLSVNIVCNNHKLGDVFYENNQICRCESNSKIYCKKLTSNEFKVDKTLCKNNKGLYQQLCNGPYFDIVCTSDSYCICEGNNGYSCPNNYSCVKNFSISPRRSNTVPGWKTLLGFELGDIGICKKN